MKPSRLLIAITCCLLVRPALADDTDALSLADQATSTKEEPSNWRTYGEMVNGSNEEHDPLDGHSFSERYQRESLNVRYDGMVQPGLRVVFDERLDETQQSGSLQDLHVGTLKEAYLDWRLQEDASIDVGRVNLRYGAASGYNPTDYFRSGAVRSAISVDPSSLRENRLGTFMVRGQTLWDGGSLSALVAPKLDTQPSNATLSPDWAATNNRQRWLIIASQSVGDDFKPQVLVYGAERQSVQTGVNVTRLFGQATVAFFEWSGGHGPLLIDQAFSRPDPDPFRSRFSTGLTYTTEDNISATLEYEYNGAGLTKPMLLNLTRQRLAYLEYLSYSSSMQELPSRQAAFIYVSWQDAIVRHLDFTGMARQDLVDHSRLNWLEARYHWDHVDVACQWQLDSGTRNSTFGAIPQWRALQFLVRYYL